MNLLTSLSKWTKIVKLPGTLLGSSLLTLQLSSSMTLAEGVVITGTKNDKPTYYYSLNAKTKTEAVRKALAQCRADRAKNCKIDSYIDSRNWLALSVNEEGDKFWVIDSDLEEAYTKALDECEMYSNEYLCEVYDLKFSY